MIKPHSTNFFSATMHALCAHNLRLSGRNGNDDVSLHFEQYPNYMIETDLIRIHLLVEKERNVLDAVTYT